MLSRHFIWEQQVENFIILLCRIIALMFKYYLYVFLWKVSLFGNTRHQSQNIAYTYYWGKFHYLVIQCFNVKVQIFTRF